LFRRQSRGPLIHPGRHSLSNPKGILIPAQLVRIEHAGENLVIRINGRPDTLASLQPIEKPDGKRTEVTIAQPILALAKFRYEVVRFTLQLRIACGRIHQGTP
jgi:hypothetical protein